MLQNRRVSFINFGWYFIQLDIDHYKQEGGGGGGGYLTDIIC